MLVRYPVARLHIEKNLILIVRPVQLRFDFQITVAFLRRPHSPRAFSNSCDCGSWLAVSAILEFADKLRARIEISDVVQGYVELRPAGTNLKGLCPFHREKSPSFNVSPSKQIFHWFGCG